MHGTLLEDTTTVLISSVEYVSPILPTAIYRGNAWNSGMTCILCTYAYTTRKTEEGGMIILLCGIEDNRTVLTSLLYTNAYAL